MSITKTAYLLHNVESGFDIIADHDLANCGYVTKASAEVTFEPDADHQLNARKIAVIERKRAEVNAEYAQKLKKIDQKLNDLRALPAPI